MEDLQSSGVQYCNFGAKLLPSKHMTSIANTNLKVTYKGEGVIIYESSSIHHQIGDNYDIYTF